MAWICVLLWCTGHVICSIIHNIVHNNTFGESRRWCENAMQMLHRWEFGCRWHWWDCKQMRPTIECHRRSRQWTRAIRTAQHQQSNLEEPWILINLYFDTLEMNLCHYFAFNFDVAILQAITNITIRWTESNDQ